MGVALGAYSVGQDIENKPGHLCISISDALFLNNRTRTDVKSAIATLALADSATLAFISLSISDRLSLAGSALFYDVAFRSMSS